MRRKPAVSAFGVLGIAVLVLGGCASLLGGESAPTHYYVLRSVAPSEAGPSAPATVAVAVAPVTMPDYLSHRSVVTRTSENEVALAGFDQWAAPLRDQIGGTLAENLSILIPSDRVIQLPANRAIPVTCEVSVEIITFERQANGDVELTARWSLFGDAGRTLLTMQRSRYRAPKIPENYDAIAAAMSTLLADLSRDIARAIRTVSSAPS